MDRYALLADLLITAADCVGNPINGCQYDIFVSAGQPPADCTHIAAFWTGSSLMPGSQKCLMKVRESFAISLNRCCLSNVGETFDPGLEDADAQCFLNDFGTLFECLLCEASNVISTYVKTGQDVNVSVAQPDSSADGNCYGGIIEISFIRHQPCCP